MNTTSIQPVRNGVKNATLLQFKGLNFWHHTELHEHITRGVTAFSKLFDSFIRQTPSGRIFLIWRHYENASEEDREVLVLIAHALGVLTRAPKAGDIRIVGYDDQIWGPMLYGEELYFVPEYMNEAQEFCSAQIRTYMPNGGSLKIAVLT